MEVFLKDIQNKSDIKNIKISVYYFHNYLEINCIAVIEPKKKIVGTAIA
jgi:hypothetical protein